MCADAGPGGPSLAVRNQSPTGTAERFYQQFEWSVIAPIEVDRWALDAGDVLNWLESGGGGDGPLGTLGGGVVRQLVTPAAVMHEPLPYPAEGAIYATDIPCRTACACSRVRYPLRRSGTEH